MPLLWILAVDTGNIHPNVYLCPNTSLSAILLVTADRSLVSVLSCQQSRVHRERAVWNGQMAQNSTAASKRN